MKSFYIPVGICEYVLRSRFYRPFQIYLYLKANCSGKMMIGTSQINVIAKDLRISSRTVKNNIAILQDCNWVGFNTQSKYYFIRGFEKIAEMYELSTGWRAVFDLSDILKVKGFVTAVSLGKMIKYQIRKKKLVERQRGRSNHTSRTSEAFYPISCSSMAQLLGISKSTAHQLKKIALADKFIALKSNVINTGVASEEIQSFRRVYPEIADRVYSMKGTIYINDVDLVWVGITFKKGKKPNYTKEGL